jgi:hypothetical protein
MNSRIYSRPNVDLERLSKKIVVYFQRKNFEVVFSSAMSPVYYSRETYHSTQGIAINLSVCE